MPSSEIKASTTDDLRLQNYRALMEQRNSAELRELQNKHKEEITRTLVANADQLDNLKRAYDVQISAEAEALDDHLHDVRATNELKIESEKKAADDELQKTKIADKERLDEFKKNSEAQMDALRKQLQATSEDLHERARKTAKRDREVSKV